MMFFLLTMDKTVSECKPSPWKQYCEVATCMGITDFYFTKSYFGKVFWSIMITAGLLVTIFNTYLTFAQYLSENDFKITISKEYVDGGIEFPNITICNFNRAKQSIINQTNLNPKVLSALFQLFPTSYELPLSILDLNEISSYQNALTDYLDMNNSNGIRNFFRSYGHNATESIRQVTFGTGLIIPFERISEAFTIYGRCWRIDINETQQISGSYVGIKLLLNPQLDDYMTNVVFNNYFEQGFAISLGYVDEPLMSDAIILAPATSSSIVLKTTRNRIVKTQFPIKEEPCQKDTSFKLLQASYTPTNCILDCYLQSIKKYCGCILLVETVSRDTPFCNISETINCANLNISPLTLAHKSGLQLFGDIAAKTIACAKNCQNPCDDFMTVETTMSTTKRKINDVDQAEKIFQQIEYSAMRNKEELTAETIQHLITAKIFFSSSDITVVDTGESTPIMTFISNVGGQLGLWMGISLFSIIQILYYAFTGCVNAFCITTDQKDFTKKNEIAID